MQHFTALLGSAENLFMFLKKLFMFLKNIKAFLSEGESNEIQNISITLAPN